MTGSFPSAGEGGKLMKNSQALAQVLRDLEHAQREARGERRARAVAAAKALVRALERTQPKVLTRQTRKGAWRE